MVQIYDDLYITIDNQTVSGWEEFRISRSIERCPSDFSISLTEHYPNKPDIILRPGAKCVVKLGDDTVITGKIDRYSPAYDPNTHKISVSGRSNCREIVDCSAWVPNGQIAGGDLFKIATDLCSPFKVQVIKNTSTQGLSIPNFTISLGEKPFGIIERITRYAGFLVYDNTDGNLVIGDIGNTKMASGLYEGVNIQSAGAEYTVDQRFSDYYIVWQAVDHLGPDVGGSNVHGHAQDPELPGQGVFRPYIAVSEQTMEGQSIAQRKAQWMANRAWGRSYAARITVDSWRDRAGKLWTPNSLIDVHSPTLKIFNRQWIISEVSFCKTPGPTAGTSAELVVMPKEAFSVEPIVIAQQNQDVLAGLQGS